MGFEGLNPMEIEQAKTCETPDERMTFIEGNQVFASKKSARVILAIAVFVLAVLLVSGCARSENTQNSAPTLEVALYPYVPDKDRFQAAVSEAWERQHPDVPLHFTNWDCYVSDPEETLDVFVFDGVYLSSFADKGLLLPIPEEKVQEKEGFLPFALDGCRVDGELFAMPQLLCADFLYTRSNDSQLSSVSDTASLYEILGDRKSKSVIPEETEGLLINLSGTLLTKTVMYLDALTDERHSYSEYAELPDPAHLSQNAVGQLRSLWKMGGDDQVSYWPKDGDVYVRALWFAEGKGRAYIGYSEALAAMGDYANDVTLRLFSYGTKENIPLFYTDMVGINAQISDSKKELALDLANVLTSAEVLERMSRKTDGGSPQYLLTSRRSVYDRLGADYPIYKQLKQVVEGPENHVFRMGANARQYLPEMEKTLSERIRQEGEAPGSAASVPAAA